MPKRGWFKALGDEFAGIFNPAVRAHAQQVHAISKLVKAFEVRAKAAARDPAPSLRWLEHNANLGGRLSPQEALDFAQAYVAQAPTVLWSLMQAARETNAEAPVTQVIMEFGKYLDQEDDLIPDGLGTIGLVDDAYFAQRMTANLLQREVHDLKASNQAIAKLLPVVIIRSLDDLISRSIGHVAATLRQFASQRAIFEASFEDSYGKARHRLDAAQIEHIRNP